MVRSGHQKIALALNGRRLRSVEESQTVHFFQIKPQTALRAVNLKSVAISPADAKPASLEAADAAIRESCHDLHRVIYFASGHEPVRVRRQLRNLAIQVPRRVERMRKQIPNRSRSCVRAFIPPALGLAGIHP